MSNAECDAQLKVNLTDTRRYECAFIRSQLNSTIYHPTCVPKGVTEVLIKDYVYDVVALNITDDASGACVNHFDCDGADPV